MPIPNAADAAFPPQAQVDSQDLEVYSRASADTGVVTLEAVTSTAAANGSVSVAAGTHKVNRVLYTGALTTVAIAANVSGLPRFDLIVTDATGIPTRVAGTAAAAPVFPAIPASSVCLAAVYVPNGHTTGTTIPANTITDKRVFVALNPYRTAAAGSAGVEFQFQHTDWAQYAFEIQLAQYFSGPFSNVGFQITDYLDAPIFYVGATGGVGVNDDITVAYSIFGPFPFRADIYGYRWQGTQANYAFAGPPGNMLDFESAMHEQYGAGRAASLGVWGPVGGCTIATFDFALPPVSPTGLRRGIRVTATGTTPWISMPAGASALSGVTPGDLVSVVCNMRSNVAAAARLWNVKLDWYTSGGTLIGSAISGPSISVPNTGVFTKLTLDNQVAPATAARVQMEVIGTVVSGETFDICGMGIMKGQQTGVFGPPFVCQNATGQRTESGALAGDIWNRLDTPSIPGQRQYVCTTGGLPGVQRWNAIDASNIYRVLSDATNSTTTMASLTDFLVPVLANTSYMMDFTIAFTTAATTTGIQFAFTGPASPTSLLIVAETQITTTTWQTATATTYTSLTASTGVTAATPALNLARVKVMLKNGANAGNVQIQFASEVGTSAVVVKAGSMLQVT